MPIKIQIQNGCCIFGSILISSDVVPICSSVNSSTKVWRSMHWLVRSPKWVQLSTICYHHGRYKFQCLCGVSRRYPEGVALTEIHHCCQSMRSGLTIGTFYNQQVVVSGRSGSESACWMLHVESEEKGWGGVNEWQGRLHKVIGMNPRIISFNPITDGGGLIAPAVWKTSYSSVSFHFWDPKT